MPGDAKWMLLWRPAVGTSIGAFAQSARESLAARLAGTGASEIVLHLSEEKQPRISLIPYRREPLALISLRGAEEKLSRAREALLDLSGTLAGWRVDESIPVPRPRSWPPGSRAPGACLLTLFRKNPRLSKDRFFAEWYGRHTPLTLEVHPVCGYIRNAVVEPVILGSGTWDGIVTEDFRERGDLRSMRRLFGGSRRALPNMVRVGLHVNRFLDLRTIENYLVAEYVLQA